MASWDENPRNRSGLGGSLRASGLLDRDLFFHEPQAHQILLRPAGLFDHALQRFPPERVVATVEDDRDSPFVGMVINQARVRRSLPREVRR